MAKKQYFARPLKERFPNTVQQTRELSAWSLLTREKLPSAAGKDRPALKTGRRVEKLLKERKKAAKLLKTSRTQRFLRHKTLPGEERHGAVQRVLKEGTSRIVSFRDGTNKRFNSPEFKEKFKAALRRTGYKNALKSMRVDAETGRTRVLVGGEKKGVEKEYESVARANAAIRRIFKQDK